MMRLILLICVACALCGCKSQPKPTVTDQDVYNSAKMGGLPDPVQRAFVRQHPNAAIISTQTIHSATGPMAYQILYREHDRTEKVWYTEAGTVTEPAPR